MGFIDNVIAAVSPKKAYEREAWRQGLEAIRGYDAAGSMPAGERTTKARRSQTGTAGTWYAPAPGTWSETAIYSRP